MNALHCSIDSRLLWGVYVGRLCWSFRCARRGSALGLGMALLLMAWPASAQDWLTRSWAALSGADDGSGPSKEIWAGSDVTADSWSAYSGMTAALFGPLHADGWRVRAVGGYGAYAYVKHGTTIHGSTSFADVLIGYHRQVGPLTVKAFGGVASENHVLSPLDLDNAVLGADLGAKAALETWLEIGSRNWAALDLSWSSVHGGNYAARARTGYRLRPDLSIGLEGAATGNAEYDGGRAGTFLRYTWSSGELSAGVGGSIDRSGESSGYGTLNALYRY